VFPIKPQIDKGKQHANSPSYETYESSSIHSKQPSTKAYSNERKIFFNDMHHEIEKLEKIKSYDKELLKYMVVLSERSKQIEESCNKKYFFFYILICMMTFPH
jgi:hypothetical protein